MKTLAAYIEWAGGQARAARLAGIHKLRMHRLFHGATLRPEEAQAIEKASEGRFPKERLIFDEEDPAMKES